MKTHHGWTYLFCVTTLIFGSSEHLSAQDLTQQLIAENPSTLVKEAREKGDVVRGAILFHQGNINCAKCHRVSAESERLGPDLSRMAPAATDELIVDSILQPSKQIKKSFESYLVLTQDGETISGIKVRENNQEVVIRDSESIDKLISIPRAEIDEIKLSQKSTMPENLANELKNRRQFLDLLRYVIDIRERGPTLNLEPKLASNRQLPAELDGLVLIRKFNCVACHSTNSNILESRSKKAPRLKWAAEKLNPEYLTSFIANPHASKPGSTMPAMLNDVHPDEREHVADAISHFLLNQTKNEFRSQTKDPTASKRGYELFHEVGCVACHLSRTIQGEEISLDEDFVPLGNVSAKYNVAAMTEFLKDPLAVRPSGHMPNMQLKHREAVDIAHFLISMSPEFTPFRPQSKLAEMGQEYFVRYHCANCHTETSESTPNRFRELEDLDPKKGCLSGQIGSWPEFRLADEEKDSVQIALGRLPISLTDQEEIDASLVSFNCTACHDRNKLGGVTTGRNPHFQTTNLNLGDQGRIPPTLSGVGAKLNSKWMRDVMVNQRSIRPYMKTRMPQFGESNVGHLLPLFERVDKLSQTEFARAPQNRDAQKAMRERGHMLAGNRGLNCVACHTYQYKISDTMPAVDLTEMTERLRKDWFYQYMLDPQKFSPNTVMPSFWPGGKAIRTDLEGSPQEQIESLWQYLIDGRQARTPQGVVRKPLQIIVTNEARMLRRSYPGIGKRGIGVGYPGGINLAYDAEQMRLGMIWLGPFVEASGVWRGQGSGNVRPMGRPVTFDKGPDLDDALHPWQVVDEERPPNHQFRGYHLDGLRRPSFRYELGATSVVDYFWQVAARENSTPSLRRKVTIQSNEAANLKFRVAAGKRIEQSNTGFTIGEKLAVTILSDHAVNIEKHGESHRLEIKMTIADGDRDEILMEYRIKQ